LRPTTCDIFCQVVDNFGDIGVCWRLSRQLASEHGLRVRLMVDDLASFKRIAPQVSADSKAQIVAGVEVRQWMDATPVDGPADLVIEAFACELPAAYQLQMAQRTPAPVWLNLEYLSAESWVESHHLLPSPHPRLPLTKYFFLPGFTRHTGGLIRERNIEIAVCPDAGAMQPSGPLRVFVFSYDAAPVEALAEGAVLDHRDISIFSTSSETHARLQHWRGSQAESGLQTAPVLEFAHCPFVRQEDFDQLLASHDILFVRGEDSFVRAQWAAKPFVWQIYPQADAAHWQKLDAFLDLYCAGLTPAPTAALRGMWSAWNGAAGSDVAAAWIEFLRWRPILEEHARQWARQLAQTADLASNLLSFYRKIAKI
jgi:uncharacterized repeat protein (TIGR03837 family)